MGMRRKALFVFLLFLPASAGTQPPPLPAEEPFFNAVRENMARASREQVRYAYKERRTELHTNPFGRLGTGDVLLYDVMPGPSPSVGAAGPRPAPRNAELLTPSPICIDPPIRGA